MAFNIFKSLLPATNPDIEMTNMDTRSRTASASQPISQPPSPHSDMDLYTDTNTAIPGSLNPAIARPSHPSGERLYPLISPPISQTQNPGSSSEAPQEGGPPISQSQNPTNPDEVLQARQPFAQFGQAVSTFGPLPSATELISSARVKKRPRPEADDPNKVRIVRQHSVSSACSTYLKVETDKKIATV